MMKPGEKVHPVFVLVMMSLALLGACKKAAPDTVAPDASSGADVSPAESAPSTDHSPPPESAPAPVEAPPAEAEPPATPAPGDGAPG